MNSRPFEPSRFSAGGVRAPRRQSGVTLMEVLIALLVLAIGLAGMAVLHLGALQYVHSAHYRSLASTIALDLEERLWLKVADTSAVDCPGSGGGSDTAVTELIEEWSRDELGDPWDWSSAELLKIPNLAVTVGTPVTGAYYTQIPVTLSWTEERFADAEATTEQFDYVIRVFCRTLT